MPDKCIECSLEPRVKALEQDNERHAETHKEIFERMRKVETENAVQDAHYKAIDAKLDELTLMVKELSGKAGKRWDSLIDKAVWALAAAVIAFALAKIGL